MALFKKRYGSTATAGSPPTSAAKAIPWGCLASPKALKNAVVGLNSRGAGLTQSAAGEGAKEAPEK